MTAYLDFEKPIAALDARIRDLRATAGETGLDLSADIARLETENARLLARTYAALTPWQKTQVARHPERPHFRDYAAGIATGFMPLGGDRLYGEDAAIVGGFATLGQRRVMLIGHEKGHDTTSRIHHNFGMGRPEGYRKAVRLMELAGRFALPVVTLVDTAGAFPGVEAEQRGQAEAIARATQACLALPVPMVAVIVGEGGSGGAVALAAAERVLMLEYAVYSVISPEGCASILWRTPDNARDAAAAMKMTAPDLIALNVIDRIVPEPVGGAHRDPPGMAQALGDVLAQELDSLCQIAPDDLQRRREERFLAIGSM